jgi:diguanylate cyclase (GGDEF)-like protein
MSLIAQHQSKPIFDVRSARDTMLVCAVVFLASLFGIMTRPLGFLAAVWPANAILLGMLIANPRLARLAGWLAALAGFLLAGFVTGDTLGTNLWLTGANIGGVAAGYLLFCRLDLQDRRLRGPRSMLQLFLVTTVAAACAALIGAGLVPALFHRNLSTGLAFWFITELSNYVITLPVLLTAPAWSEHRAAGSWRNLSIPSPRNALPVVAVCASLAGAIIVGGPGSIAFAVPALMWCALTYTLFPMSVITFMASLAMLIAESAGMMALPPGSDYIGNAMSFRLGITLIALAPLTITSILAIQKDLLARLDLAASRDGLTGIQTRSVYLDKSAQLLERVRRAHAANVAILMIDIDHFKKINDRYGHAAGDTALVAVTAEIALHLRQGDLFGRLGGEEFSAMLSNVSPDDAVFIAERLRQSVEALQIPCEDGTALQSTISIGIIHCAAFPECCLAKLLSLADGALYGAKRHGRNRLEHVSQPATVAAPAMPA